MAVLIWITEHVLQTNPAVIDTLTCRFENVLRMAMAKQAMSVSSIASLMNVLVMRMAKFMMIDDFIFSVRTSFCVNVSKELMVKLAAMVSSFLDCQLWLWLGSYFWADYSHAIDDDC